MGPRADLDMESEHSCLYRESKSSLSVVQPVASRSTDCATTTLVMNYIITKIFQINNFLARTLFTRIKLRRLVNYSFNGTFECTSYFPGNILLTLNHTQ
jgi:hypothetical protein